MAECGSRGSGGAPRLLYLLHACDLLLRPHGPSWSCLTWIIHCGLYVPCCNCKLWVDTHVDPPLQRRGAALNEVFDRCVRVAYAQLRSSHVLLPRRAVRYSDPYTRDILFELKRRNVLIAAASRTCAPRVARQALQGLWIAPTPGETPVPAGCTSTH